MKENLKIIAETKIKLDSFMRNINEGDPYFVELNS